MSVPDAAAERLHALYVDELVQTLMPPVHPMVDTRQTQALIRHARATGPHRCEASDETTWIWSDLHLEHKVSLGIFFRPFGTVRWADQAMMDAWYDMVGADDTNRLPGRRQCRRQRPGAPPALVAGGARRQVARARQPRRRSGEPGAAGRGGRDRGHAVRTRRSAAAADARTAVAGAARLGERARTRAPKGVAEQEPAHQRQRRAVELPAFEAVRHPAAGAPPAGRKERPRPQHPGAAQRRGTRDAMTRATTLEVPRRQLRHERRGMATSRPARTRTRARGAVGRRSCGVPDDRMLPPSLRQPERQHRDRRDRTQVGGVTQALVADASWCRSPVFPRPLPGHHGADDPGPWGTCRRALSRRGDSRRCAAQRCVRAGRPGSSTRTNRPTDRVLNGRRPILTGRTAYA